MPFLYQTRTILRKPRRLRLPTGRGLHEEQRPTDISHDPSAPGQDAASPRSFLKEKADMVSLRSPAISDATVISITPAERKAFDTLLNLPFVPQTSKGPGAGSVDDSTVTDVDYILNIFSLPAKGHHGEERHSHTGDQTGVINATDPDSSDDSVHRITRSRMEEIATALNHAIAPGSERGDIRLWKVCQEMIFPLVKELDLQTRQEKPNDRARNAEPASRFTSNPPIPTEEGIDSPQGTLIEKPNSGSPQQLPSPATPLAVISRLYPAALLLALRLYIKHFPTSPLPHTLLPHIRMLGPASYVLGANTHFYNSLMSLKWSVFSNLREIDSLLAEMERGGVNFDQQTYKMLSDIENERSAELRNDKGTKGSIWGRRGPEWWKRQEQVRWFPRIREWKTLLARRLEEQGFANVPREGNHEAEIDLGDNVGAATGERAYQKKVWL